MIILFLEVHFIATSYSTINRIIRALIVLAKQEGIIICYIMSCFIFKVVKEIVSESVKKVKSWSMKP